MNKIKIFLAGSADELCAERLELSDFVRRLNDCYLDKDLYFVLTSNVDAEPDIRDSTDIKVSGYDLAFFLFGAKLDKKVFDAFEAVFASYKKTGKPKIVTYFKEDVKQPTSEEIEVLQERLETDPDYFYYSYSHIDTLKLGVLMTIKRLDLNGVDIRLENGKAWQGSDMLLSLDHVEMLCGYEELERLKTERSRLENNFYEALAKYAENPDDTALYETYIEASGYRNGAIKEIRDIETRLYHMLEGMYEQTAQGRISKRQAESYKLIERGLLSEARMVLDFNAIISESRHDEEIAEQTAKRAQVHIRELMHLKDVDAALFDWDGVDDCFKEASRLEKKHFLPCKSSIDYVMFLYQQNRYNEAIDFGEELRRYLESPGAIPPDGDDSFIYNSLGVLYMSVNHFAEAEAMLKKALARRRSKAESEPEKFELKTAGTANALGNMYKEAQRYDEALEMLKLSLELHERLYNRNPAAIEERLAIAHQNIGIIYVKMEKWDEALKHNLTARDMFIKLAASKPDPIEYYLAGVYANTGLLYRQMKRYSDSEEQIKTAIKILQRLVKNNPRAYEPFLAESYHSLGQTLTEAKRYSEAEETQKTAVETFQRLDVRSPGAFEPKLAHCYKELGRLYSEMKRFAEAEEVLYSAIRLYEKHLEIHPALTEHINEARELLDKIYPPKLPAMSGEDQLTAEERDVALLLIEGDTQRDISRKLRLSASEVRQRINSIRAKVIVGDDDPVISSIVSKYKLSGRETDILRCLHRNMTNTEIAADRFISEEAVRVHVHNLIKKLPVETRNDLPEWIAAYTVSSELKE